jgi:hypothetical protein
MYVLPKCHKKSAMIKSNPSCSVRNACRVHFRHRHIISFTFFKSNIFKTLNWSWKFFLFLCQFLFSHPPMKSFSIKLCYTCLIEIQFYVQLQFVFLQVFLLPIASITRVRCCYYICIPIALNKTSLDVYNAMVYEALSGSHLISLAYISICFSQLFVGEGFNTPVKCPSSHHYRQR